MIRNSTLVALAILVLLSLAMLSGCGQGAQASMAGTYDLDKEKVKADLQKRIDATEDEEEKVGMQMMAGFIDAMTMTLTLNEDGSATGRFVMMGETEDATGTWSVADSTMSVSLASEGEAPETLTGTIDGDRFELTSLADGDGNAPPFNLSFKKLATE